MIHPQHRQKIHLTQAQETLLITLYSKASESQRPHPIFTDPGAAQLLEGVDYDFKRLRVPRKTTLMVCMRANKLDAVARQFLHSSPQGPVLHLGCGLDNRFQRLDNGQVVWYDLDLPDVIELRRQFFPESDRCRMLAASAADLDWLDQIAPHDRQALVVAEGLLMYLTGPQVKSLVLALKDAFPACRLACDVFSQLTARRATDHQSLHQTGAAIQWGLDDSHAPESWAPGIRLVEEWYFSAAPEVARLDAFYRLSFRLAGSFTIANKAHRILVYDL